LINADRGNCKGIFSKKPLARICGVPAYFGTLADQVVVLLGDLVPPHSIAKTFDVRDSVLEKVKHDLPGDSIRTHDHDELAVEKGRLVLGELDGRVSITTPRRA
jgi:hypothetical protein